MPLRFAAGVPVLGAAERCDGCERARALEQRSDGAGIVSPAGKETWCRVVEIQVEHRQRGVQPRVPGFVNESDCEGRDVVGVGDPDGSESVGVGRGDVSLGIR